LIVKKEKEAFACFEELVALTTGANNFCAYREKLRSTNPPCIPYMGRYQTDLTFIEDGNAESLSNGYVNFFKRRLKAEIIREIQTYQQTGYNLIEVEPVMNWIKASSSESINVDEETIYNVSLIIEPREESKRKTISKKPSKATKSAERLTIEPSPKQPVIRSSSEEGVPGSRKSKLNKFFGEDEVDFAFYQKYSKQEPPKSILNDVEVEASVLVTPPPVPPPPEEIVSFGQLSPQQVEEYKQSMIAKYTDTSPIDNAQTMDEHLLQQYKADEGWL